MSKKITTQSAAKPQVEEGSETIPQGSTPILGGSATPQTDNAVGDDIVQNKNRDAFIKKANVKFNNKFDYSNVEYVSAKTKVCIICPEHGEFWQTPDKHLQSKFACPKCTANLRTYATPDVEKLRESHLVTKEKFIELANAKYNNKYTYIIDDWTGIVSSDVKVICPIHGEFITNARAHLLKGNTTGCPKCGNDKRAKSKTESYSYVVDRMKKLYNNYYSYEANPNYINHRSKIKIYCPVHGEFVKSIQKHLSGQECPQCTLEENIQTGLYPGGYCEQVFEDNPELKQKAAYLYYLEVNEGDCYKIGITSCSPKDRIKALKNKGNSLNYTLDFKLLAVKETTLYDAFCLEQQILDEYSKFRIYRRWSTELLNTNIFEQIKHNFTTIF